MMSVPHKASEEVRRPTPEDQYFWNKDPYLAWAWDHDPDLYPIVATQERFDLLAKRVSRRWKVSDLEARQMLHESRRRYRTYPKAQRGKSPANRLVIDKPRYEVTPLILLCDLCHAQRWPSDHSTYRTVEIAHGTLGVCCEQCWPKTYEYRREREEERKRQELAKEERTRRELAKLVSPHDPRVTAAIKDASRPIPNDLSDGASCEGYLLNPDYTLSLKPES